MLFRPLYQFPARVQRWYRHVLWRCNVAQRAVYLTFDDGPIPEMTPKILAILREKQVKATFFCVGDNARKYPELLRMILADGHRVGNHTFHHLPGLKTSLSAYLRDVSDCDALLRQAGAQMDKPLFRPPYGRMKPSQKRELLNAGYTIVLWDVLTHDYNQAYAPDKMLEVIRRYTRNGSIVVFHDSLKSSERMLEVLPKAIDFWRQEGYELRIL